MPPKATDFGDSLGSIRGEFGYAQIRDRGPDSDADKGECV